MTEGKNKASVRYIRRIAGGPRHKCAVSNRFITYSRLNVKSDKFV